MNNNLQKGIDEIKDIKMTASEKRRVFEYVLNSSPSEQPLRSPWVNPFMLMIQKNHLAYYVVVPLIIILASGGVAFASGDSLPNSILYPIKVSVVEPIRGALTFSPGNKAQFESNLATARLVEAETLAGEGKLDKPTEKRLNNLLEKHTASLNKALDKTDKMVQTVESTVRTDEIVTNFHANMNAHARVLDILNNKKEDQSNTLSEDISKDDVEISKTARDNADKVRNISKDKENEKIKEDKDESKKKEKSDKYKKRKEAVQSLIDKTTTELDDVSIPSSSSRQEIIESTNETLKEAKKFLDEADSHEEEGNSEDAYSTLLDSESSVKEAGIFLETGMRFEEENKGGKSD